MAFPMAASLATAVLPWSCKKTLSTKVTSINTTVVIPLTTNLSMAEYPCNEFLSANETGLPKDSIVLTPQIGVVDKNRLEEKVSKLSKETMQRISLSIMKLLDLR